jgi:hypothetical protein
MSEQFCHLIYSEISPTKIIKIEFKKCHLSSTL